MRYATWPREVVRRHGSWDCYGRSWQEREPRRGARSGARPRLALLPRFRRPDAAGHRRLAAAGGVACPVPRVRSSQSAQGRGIAGARGLVARRSVREPGPWRVGAALAPGPVGSGRACRLGGGLDTLRGKPRGVGVGSLSPQRGACGDLRLRPGRVPCGPVRPLVRRSSHRDGHGGRVRIARLCVRPAAILTSRPDRVVPDVAGVVVVRQRRHARRLPGVPVRAGAGIGALGPRQMALARVVGSHGADHPGAGGNGDARGVDRGLRPGDVYGLGGLAPTPACLASTETHVRRVGCRPDSGRRRRHRPRPTRPRRTLGGVGFGAADNAHNFLIQARGTLGIPGLVLTAWALVRTAIESYGGLRAAKGRSRLLLVALWGALIGMMAVSYTHLT